MAGSKGINTNPDIVQQQASYGWQKRFQKFQIKVLLQ